MCIKAYSFLDDTQTRISHTPYQLFLTVFCIKIIRRNIKHACRHFGLKKRKWWQVHLFVVMSFKPLNKSYLLINSYFLALAPINIQFRLYHQIIIVSTIELIKWM